MYNKARGMRYDLKVEMQKNYNNYKDNSKKEAEAKSENNPNTENDIKNKDAKEKTSCKCCYIY